MTAINLSLEAKLIDEVMCAWQYIGVSFCFASNSETP